MVSASASLSFIYRADAQAHGRTAEKEQKEDLRSRRLALEPPFRCTISQ